MDSVSRSTVAGRIAGPVFVSLGALLAYFFGIEVDPKTMEVGIDATVQVISGLSALWGFYTAIRSKLRQKKEIKMGCAE